MLKSSSAISTVSPTSLNTSSLPPQSSHPSSASHSPMSATSSIDSAASSTATSSCSCRNCGAAMPVVSEADYPKEAQLRIEELEQQVKEFSVRAVMAADDLAHSQRELMEIRRKSEATNPPSSPPRTGTSTISAIQGFSRVGSNKINQFFTSRSNSVTSQPPNIATLTNRPSTPEAYLERASMESQVLTDLSNQLCEEKRSRETAEKQLADVKSELEELSMNLFQQANEMVANERKARAKLEERVALLEKRDKDKAVRVERLEKALQRIQRVKGVLAGTH